MAQIRRLSQSKIEKAEVDRDGRATLTAYDALDFLDTPARLNEPKSCSFRAAGPAGA
jgi:hypothetical protein